MCSVQWLDYIKRITYTIFYIKLTILESISITLIVSSDFQLNVIRSFHWLNDFKTILNIRLFSSKYIYKVRINRINEAVSAH